MFYTKQFTDEFEKERALTLKHGLIEKIGRVVKVAKDSNRFDLTLVLPSGDVVYVSLILGLHQWHDLYCPLTLIRANPAPHLLWFCTVQNGEIININSLKTSVFGQLARDAVEPEVKKVISADLNVRFESNDDINPKIKPSLCEWKGFSLNAVRAYELPFDSLLDEKIQFSFHEFDPAITDTDAGLWFYIHVMGALQKGTFASYSTLTERYQQYLAR